MKYSATTVLMPELTMAEQAAMLSRLGFDGVELRVRRVSDELRAKAEPSNWGYHVNDVTPENFAEKSGEINQILADHGLSFVGIAANAPCTDLEQIKHLVEGAVKCGSPMLRVGASSGFKADGNQNYWEIYGETVAGFARVLELTKGTGIKLLIEMHGNTIHPSASLAYRIASNFSPEDVGVIYDPQNMVRDGYETIALALQLLGPYLAHCHLGAHRPAASETNDKGTVQWKWDRCGLAEGLFDIPTMLQQFEKVGYEGFISIEDFGGLPVEEKLTQAITYLKSL
jgi:sugar phosphate isomerase/epimerase